ncbi:MAG TPA: phosphate acetyltransferase, partial [Epsilonproteobacteria bacterium]|nr:phosphate acetyltransferase [Campylobacterota bacterium]
ISNDGKRDSDIDFMLKHFNLNISYEACLGFTINDYVEAYADGREDKLFELLFDKIDQLHQAYDFILIEGYPRTVFASALDFDLNLEIAKNINTAYVPVLNAKGKSVESILNEVQFATESIEEEACIHLATFVNRCDPNMIDDIKRLIPDREQIFLLPEEKELDTPIIREVVDALKEEKAEMIMGEPEQLEHLVSKKKIAAMGVENYLKRMTSDSLVIVPGDRVDIILATMLSFYGKKHPNVAGIILSGGMKPSKTIMNLLKDVDESVLPILAVESDSYQTAIALNSVQAVMRPENKRKITLAKGIFDAAVDKKAIADRFNKSSSEIMTPMMFEYKLFERAQSRRQRIVLPESSDERILRATEILLRRDIVDIILLGNKKEIRHQSALLRLDISRATIINPCKSKLREVFSQKFYALRKHKGLTLKAARDALEHPNYFGTMMIQEGMADGMVSGATHTTADTVRPALQIIKTKPGISIVSSLFFMCLDTKVLVYGDCAVNLDPGASELAQIAISSAETAEQFGIEARVAMLSYSTGDSG